MQDKILSFFPMSRFEQFVIIYIGMVRRYDSCYFLIRMLTDFLSQNTICPASPNPSRNTEVIKNIFPIGLCQA